MRRLMSIAIIAAVALLQGTVVHAQFPDRPLRMIVAFPAGGSADIVARLVAEELRTGLGQAIVVENRTGGAGNVAAQAVVSAAPDGYTFLLSTSALAINPWISPVGFSPLKDLAITTRVASAPYVLVVKSTSPVKSLQDFVAAAKAEPGKPTCSTYGVGSPPHLALELLKREAGINVVHAPYRGFGQALPDLLSGLLSCSVETTPNIEQHVASGALRAVAVTSAVPFAPFPGAPPMATFYPKVVVEGWLGVFVPANTPKPILDRLNAEVVKVVRDLKIADRLRVLGYTPVGDSPEAAAATFTAEYERFGELIRSLNLRRD